MKVIEAKINTDSVKESFGVNFDGEQDIVKESNNGMGNDLTLVAKIATMFTFTTNSYHELA